jgi:hypothetical protein
MEGAVKASPASDPRSGLWIFGAGRNYIIRLDQHTGSELERIDIAAVAGAPGKHVPASAMTIARTPDGRPAVVLGVRPLSMQGVALVYAVNLATHELLWKVRVPPGDTRDWTAGQFPILDIAGRRVIVFTTQRSGAYFISQPRESR